MSTALNLDPPSGTTLPRASGCCSKSLLSELLALNEEMIDQLNLERLGISGTTDFITHMIAQHEKAAAMLRAQLADMPRTRSDRR